MRIAVRKLGNSAGIIISKSLLGEIGMAVGDSVDMTLQEGRIILTPVKARPRAGWAEASQQIAQTSDDVLVWPEFGNADDHNLIW